MRVVCTSDLHTDSGATNAALVPLLVAAATALHPDVFILAGDLAETTAQVRDNLRQLARIPGRKLYLPGNHDLYVEGTAALAAGETSRIKFERTLPAAAHAAGFEYLGLAPIDCGTVTVLGIPGWYDYSLRDPALDVAVSMQHYRNGQWREHRAYDRGHVRWDGASGWLDDEALAAEMLRRLEAQLHTAPAERPILAVVHVLPFAALVQRGAFGPSPFHEAYLGSTALGDRLRDDPRVQAVVTGHLHRPADMRIGTIRVVARPVGTRRDPGADLSVLARERLAVFDVG